MKTFVDELKNLNICDKMYKNINCCPQYNYEVFASFVKFAREKHVPSKIVKYNKRKHMQLKWMIQTDTDDEHLYTILKSEFITHRTDLRTNFRKTNVPTILEHLNCIKNDIKTHALL